LSVVRAAQKIGNLAFRRRSPVLRVERQNGRSKRNRKCASYVGNRIFPDLGKGEIADDTDRSRNAKIPTPPKEGGMGHPVQGFFVD
jgi:hypothetical protein